MPLRSDASAVQGIGPAEHAWPDGLLFVPSATVVDSTVPPSMESRRRRSLHPSSPWKLGASSGSSPTFTSKGATFPKYAW